jgi:hypothetical protein
MKVTLNDLTDKLAAWLISPPPEGQSNELRIHQKSYEIQAIGFNITSCALVLTVALAFFTAISMYAAFVLAVPLYFLRHALIESLDAADTQGRLKVGAFEKDTLTIFGHVFWKSLLPSPVAAPAGAPPAAAAADQKVAR